MMPLLGAVLAAVLAAAILRWLPRVTTTPPGSQPPLTIPGRAVAPLALVLVALLGAGAGWIGAGTVQAVVLALVAGTWGVLVAVDLAEHRLPDTVIAAGIALWAVGALLMAALGGEWAPAGRSVAAAFALFAGFYVLAVLARGALGFGDVKLAFLLGAVLGWFGWRVALTGAVLGVILHGLVALVVLAITRDRTADVPMGPALVAAAAAALALLT